MSLDDKTTASTADEVKAAIYATLERTGISTANWRPFGVLRTMIAIFAAFLAVVAQLVAAIARQGFLDTAEEDWLDDKAAGDFDCARRQATPASGQLRVVNSSVATYALAIGDFVAANPSTGVEYANLVAYSLTPGTHFLDVASRTTGSAASSGVGAISRVVSALPGVTCSNLGPLNGTDKEKDEEFRQRARLEPLGTSPGAPAGAYVRAILAAKREDGSPIGVTRVRALPGVAGAVSCVVATATGVLAESDRLLLEEIAWRDCAALCTWPEVVQAEPVVVPVTIAVYVDSAGASKAEIESKAAAAVAAHFAAVPIGGYTIAGSSGTLYREAIGGAVRAALGPSVFLVVVLGPTGNVSLGPTQIPVPGAVSIVVYLEAQRAF